MTSASDLIKRIRVERRESHRKMAPWIEEQTLRAIEETYEAYRKGLMRKEPCLTATFIVDVMPASSPHADWQVEDRSEKISLVQAAIMRLKRKGKIISSLGEGFGGKETHCWEPQG